MILVRLVPPIAVAAWIAIAHAAPPIPDQTGIEVDRAAGTITVHARAQPSAFVSSVPPDHQYHALAHLDGTAADGALFVTDVQALAVARALRALGADDGGGVPASAWTLRWVPLVPQPNARVRGSRIDVTVRWGNEAPVPLAELLEDAGGAGFDFRFGGNEERADDEPTGCIVCLYSCPGGPVSNAAYTIRDHQRGTTRFLPTSAMPPEDTPVEITFTLHVDPASPARSPPAIDDIRTPLHR